MWSVNFDLFDLFGQCIRALCETLLADKPSLSQGEHPSFKTHSFWNALLLTASLHKWISPHQRTPPRKNPPWVHIFKTHLLLHYHVSEAVAKECSYKIQSPLRPLLAALFVSFVVVVFVQMTNLHTLSSCKWVYKPSPETIPLAIIFVFSLCSSSCFIIMYVKQSFKNMPHEKKLHFF